MPMTDRRPAGSAADLSGSPVVELRQYTLHPGKRDVLVELFERELVDSQEELGIRVGGIFRDLGDPDRFVWMRGFPDMAARRDALTGFYTGPVWRRHREAANATMVDSDDVLLLRPTAPAHPPPLAPHARRGVGDEPGRPQVVVAHVHELASNDLEHWLAEEVPPVLEEVLGVGVGTWATLAAPNSFPQLPVREGVHAFVWTATFTGRSVAEASLARLAADPRWRQDVEPRLAAGVRRTQRLWLEPTLRSQHPAPHRTAAGAP